MRVVPSRRGERATGVGEVVGAGGLLQHHQQLGALSGALGWDVGGEAELLVRRQVHRARELEGGEAPAIDVAELQHRGDAPGLAARGGVRRDLGADVLGPSRQGLLRRADDLRQRSAFGLDGQVGLSRRPPARTALREDHEQSLVRGELDLHLGDVARVERLGERLALAAQRPPDLGSSPGRERQALFDLALGVVDDEVDLPIFELPMRVAEGRTVGGRAEVGAQERVERLGQQQLMSLRQVDAHAVVVSAVEGGGVGRRLAEDLGREARDLAAGEVLRRVLRDRAEGDHDAAAAEQLGHLLRRGGRQHIHLRQDQDAVVRLRDPHGALGDVRALQRIGVHVVEVALGDEQAAGQIAEGAVDILRRGGGGCAVRRGYVVGPERVDRVEHRDVADVPPAREHDAKAADVVVHLALLSGVERLPTVVRGRRVDAREVQQVVGAADPFGADRLNGAVVALGAVSLHVIARLAHGLLIVVEMSDGADHLGDVPLHGGRVRREAVDAGDVEIASAGEEIAVVGDVRGKLLLPQQMTRGGDAVRVAPVLDLLEVGGADQLPHQPPEVAAGRPCVGTGVGEQRGQEGQEIVTVPLLELAAEVRRPGDCGVRVGPDEEAHQRRLVGEDGLPGLHQIGEAAGVLVVRQLQEAGDGLFHQQVGVRQIVG